MAKKTNGIEIDDDWEAEDDARILAEAEKIKNDPKRLNKAKNIASKISERILEDAKAYKKIGNKSTKPIKKGKK
jgi:hypothetical protein